MVIVTRKCDKCGKEETNARAMAYVGVNGYMFDICRECLEVLITEEMLEKKSVEETLRSIMDKTAVPFN